MSLRKQTIAIDLDDVLASSAQGFVAFSNKKWGTNLTVEDFTEQWGVMWGVDIDEERRRAGDVYDARIIRKFSSVDRAKPVLQKLSEDYHLIVMTSRVNRMKEDTFEWLDTHYKGIFDDVHFSGFYDKITKSSHSYTKAEICREIGSDYLIDDQIKHCFAAAKAGIESLLFGNFSWNQYEELPSRVTRVRDWNEIGEYFAGRG